MNTGTTTNTDSDLVTNTEAHIDTGMDIDMVMHRQSHGEPTSGHAGSDTFKYNGRGPGHGRTHEYWM